MALVLSAVTLLSVASLSQVAAQTQDEGRPEARQDEGRRGWGLESLIAKLVERFGLNQDEVEAVFEEVKEEKRTEISQRYEERLDEAVASGELTEEQKTLILQKRDELRAEKEQYKDQDLTNEEKQALREQHKQEIEQWAADNGIDTQYLMGPKGGQGPRGEGGTGLRQGGGQQPRTQ